MNIWLIAGVLLTPVAPAPARSVELTAPGPLAPLHGTLLLPAGLPSVTMVIIPGSGPTDRDAGPGHVRATRRRALARRRRLGRGAERARLSNPRSGPGGRAFRPTNGSGRPARGGGPDGREAAPGQRREGNSRVRAARSTAGTATRRCPRRRQITGSRWPSVIPTASAAAPMASRSGLRSGSGPFRADSSAGSAGRSAG